jgi:protein SCO1/2
MKPVQFFLIFLFCALLSATCLADSVTLKAGEFSPARQAPDFIVRGSGGSDLKLANYRGKVVVLGFGYTSCPNVCPVTLAVLSQAHRALGALASQVQVIYLTVDPERDSVTQLKKYLAAFDSSFIGGTGTIDEMAAICKDYGVTVEKHGSGNDYVIAHSSFVYLIDRNGKLRALMPFGSKADDYVHDITQLLKK